MNEDKKWKYVRALTRKAFFETQQQETQKNKKHAEDDSAEIALTKTQLKQHSDETLN